MAVFKTYVNKLHKIDAMTLTLKYDTIDEELRGGEFRNGISIEIWVGDPIEGVPTPSVLSYCNGSERGRGRWIAVASIFCEKKCGVPKFDTPVPPL